MCGFILAAIDGVSRVVVTADRTLAAFGALSVVALQEAEEAGDYGCDDDSGRTDPGNDILGSPVQPGHITPSDQPIANSAQGGFPRT
ncbi:hypothetical protein ABZ923_14635 [Streptomyces sp. NPDC046881]|uniref:hypothetical protein n=1 Tax=Streptomyces sp. NPDC046881 TaxID=3155374 RepID=UPI0033DFA27E